MTFDGPYDLSRIRTTVLGRNVDYHAVIDSTNDQAKRCAADPKCRLPLLVLAGHQTAGRGRGSNRWWSSDGCVMFTLALGPEWLPDQLRVAAMASLAVALAVVDAVAPLVPTQGLGVHWPNDVVAADRKLSGILIEVVGGRRYLIGVGVNCNNQFDAAPEEVRQRATSLRELSGHLHDPTSLLVDLLGALDNRLAELKRDPPAIARRANDLCLQRGQDLTVAQGDSRITGRCDGIAADGSLMLRTPTGPHLLSSGTICRK